MITAAEVVAAINAKELDDALTEIKAAVVAREDTGDVTERWRIQYGDEVIDHTTVTVGEAIKFGDMRSRDFRAADPVYSTADRVALVLARVMTNNDTLTIADAAKLVDVKPLESIVVTTFIEVDPPKER